MFRKRHLMRDGAKAQALVLDKRIYAQTVQSLTVTACGYQLRVQFDDGSTSEVFRRVMHRDGCTAVVGNVIPVRYDPDDRSSVEVDVDAMKAQDEAQSARRKADAIARGEAELRGDKPQTVGAVGEEFVESAAEFRDQAAEFRETTEVFAAMARAKAAGNQAEVDRLKAELLRRTAGKGDPPSSGSDRPA